jgi:hypothetical protein
VNRSNASPLVHGVFVVVSVLAFVAACSSSHKPPTLSADRSTDGTRAAFAGVAVTVPAYWHLYQHSPALCGSVIGRAAYFYIGSNSPRPGCASSPPTGPYLTVECHPYGPTPTGSVTRVGPFDAIVQGATVDAGTAQITIYLTGRDTAIGLYGPPNVVNAIESSIGRAAGSC